MYAVVAIIYIEWPHVWHMAEGGNCNAILMSMTHKVVEMPNTHKTLQKSHNL